MHITELRCPTCNKVWQGGKSASSSHSQECADCIAAKRREYFKSLDKLTTEERLRKIEEWIYDYDNNRLVEANWDGRYGTDG